MRVRASDLKQKVPSGVLMKPSLSTTQTPWPTKKLSLLCSSAVSSSSLAGLGNTPEDPDLW